MKIIAFAAILLSQIAVATTPGWNGADVTTGSATASVASNLTNIGGTVTSSVATTSITATGSHFETTLAKGDRVSLSDASSTYATVVSVTSDTTVTVDTALGGGCSGGCTINRNRYLLRAADALDATQLLVQDNGDIMLPNSTAGAVCYSDSAKHLKSFPSGTTSQFLRGDFTWVTAVTSVGLTLPSWLSVAGSPVTSSGTLAVTAAAGQTANQFLATPNGTTGAVGLRAIVGADLPNPSATALGGVESIASTSHQWIDSISTSGVPHQSQPAFTDISGLLSVSQINATGTPSSSTYLRGDGSWSTVSGGVTTVGTYDSQTASANGLVISGSSIYAQSASTTNPGMVKASGSQTFGVSPTFGRTTVTDSSRSLVFGTAVDGGFAFLSLANASPQDISLGGSPVLRFNGDGTVGHNVMHAVTDFLGGGNAIATDIGRNVGFYELYPFRNEYLTGGIILNSPTTGTTTAPATGAIKVVTGTPLTLDADQVQSATGVTLTTSGTQPTCDSAHRGMLWNIQGGTGVADTLQICMKDASDAYAWVTK